MGSILGGSSTENPSNLPPWARDFLGDEAFRGPNRRFNDDGGFGVLPPGEYGPQNLGPFSDILAGYGGLSGSDLFGGFGGFPQMGQMMGANFAGMGFGGGADAFQNNAALGAYGQGADDGPFDMNKYFTGLSPGIFGASMDYADPIYGMLTGRTGGNATAFHGQAGDAALAQMANTGPQGDIYERTLDIMRPQVTASYAARGLGDSNIAAGAESDQARQLADSFAQRAMQERIGLLGQAVGGEGADASMTGALGSTMANMLNTRLNGALGAAQLPGQVQGQMLGNQGASIQNLMGLAGLNLTPLQGGLQGQNLANQGMQMPIGINQGLYNLSRTPYLQLLQAASGAAPLGQGSEYRGIFGIPK